MKRAIPAVTALLIGALAFGLTAILAVHERDFRSDTLHAGFDQAVRQTVGRVEQRMASYEQMLRGAQGLFASSQQVDRGEYDAYVETLRAGSDFNGLQTITYAPLLSAAQIDHHVAEQRATGAPGYTITPPGRREWYAPITYVGPSSAANLPALGYDPLSDPTRQAALLRAGGSGGAAITERIRLVTETAASRPFGFLLVLPLYTAGEPIGTPEERRASLRGWVWAAFRAADLMASLYGDDVPGLDVRLYDGVGTEPERLVYERRADPDHDAPAQFTSHTYIAVAGQNWTLDVRSTALFAPRFETDTLRLTRGLMGAGAVLSALLALLIYQLMTAHARAYAAARAMTRELRDSEERYRRIVETANEGIWLVDERNRVTFANPKLLQMLGYAATELAQRPLLELIDARDQYAATRSGFGDTQSVRLRRKDGSALWVSVSTASIVDAAGAKAGALGMVTDITERKQARARRELLEAQLRESQKMEAIGTLAGGIAHDFNNILAAILGHVTLARAHLATSRGAGADLDQIERAGVRARSLVEKILAFSRMQPQALLSQPMRPLIEDAVVLLRSTLPSSVSLELDLTSTTLQVNADATGIQQVIMNLCTNAWHSFDGASGRISIGLARVELDAERARRLGEIAPGPCAHLTITDTGSGMDEATRARVFEPFFTTKRVGQGTGLGLSVAHGIVVAHRGAISVDSAPGQGSTFHLYFPLLAAPTAAPPPVLEPVADPQAPRGHGEHVMYVDDDPTMLLVIEALLQQAGYRVSTFEGAREALAQVASAPAAFDLIITDFNMPEMSGTELAEALARLAPGVPVIISSGYLSDEVRAAAARVGVRGLLQKEYSVEQLAGLVHSVLSTA